jgi:hypothetical protein
LAAVAAFGSNVLVVPGGDATTEGNSSNGLPFNITGIGETSERYQQVYGSSAFGDSSILITGIDFRPDAAFGSAFSNTIPSIQIDLSTTPSAVDALSLTFANNVGADDVTVFPDGALSLSSADSGPAGGPEAFDIHIQFTTPFLYDPESGNLLLDVRVFDGASTTQFDAANSKTDAVSRVYTIGSGVDSATANGADSIGLVTQFDFSDPLSVPEPSTTLLSGAGLAAAFAFRRLRRSRRPSISESL